LSDILSDKKEDNMNDKRVPVQTKNVTWAKKSRLIRVDGRAEKSDIEKLKRANLNISAIIRVAIQTAAKKVRS